VINRASVCLSLSHNGLFPSIILIEQLRNRYHNYFINLIRTDPESIGVRDNANYRRNPVACGDSCHIIHHAQYDHILGLYANLFKGFPQSCLFKTFIIFFTDPPRKGYLTLVMFNLLAPSDEKDMVRFMYGEQRNEYSGVPKLFTVDNRSIPFR